MQNLRDERNLDLGGTDYNCKYSHKLRWYNITLQEKGFHHIIGVLDTSNINGVIILNIYF
ncbi:hypothetical protein H8356DRAFT_1350162 [Neocallimastix lanati (nom. inval.)]|nr:hypothetical protein H8356DRAFT_1350162 [Neocallimastix sp. JGI-2020a]